MVILLSKQINEVTLKLLQKMTTVIVTAVLTSKEINYDWENIRDNILLLIKLFMDYVELWSIEMKVKRIDDALKATF